MSQRAILFIDGSNWYHSLRRNAVTAPMELDYGKISHKLLGPREWMQTRYYIGALQQEWNPRAYADQRRFLDRLQRTDDRITVQLGRLEPRLETNPLAEKLAALVASEQLRSDRSARRSMSLRPGTRTLPFCVRRPSTSCSLWIFSAWQAKGGTTLPISSAPTAILLPR